MLVMGLRGGGSEPQRGALLIPGHPTGKQGMSEYPAIQK